MEVPPDAFSILFCCTFLVLVGYFHSCTQEDRKMVELVGLFGPKRWSAISQRFPGRIGKQCRERLVTPLRFPCHPKLRQHLVAFAPLHGLPAVPWRCIADWPWLSPSLPLPLSLSLSLSPSPSIYLYLNILWLSIYLAVSGCQLKRWHIVSCGTGCDIVRMAISDARKLFRTRLVVI